MHRFANPGRFLRLADRLQPGLIVMTILAFAVGLYHALWESPADYQQGETVRIMYIHVPAAWLALFAYCLIAVASACGLVWRHPLAHIAAEAASPIGAGFTFIALVSGSLWGRPMWGVYWVWDARLTSFLLLFFVYLGHMALTQAFDDRQRGQRTAAILALVGAVNVPVIKFSVDWWNTLHQPASILRSGGPSIDPSMLSPLFLMAIAFQLFFFVVMLARMKAAILAARSQSLLFNRLRMQATPASGPATGGGGAN